MQESLSHPAPGLGIELDEDALTDQLDHDWKNARVDAEDGSAIDR